MPKIVNLNECTSQIYIIDTENLYIFKIISLTLILYLVLQNSILAQGGPPMLTDDPVPVEKGHWEINNAFTLEHTSNSDIFEAPLEDFNYGALNNMHIKFEVPLIINHIAGSPTIGGLGKSSFGSKWRFYNNEKSKVSVSMFPAISFNILKSSSERGITDDGVEFALPFSFMVEKDKSSLVLEAGREFASKDQGGWIFGSLYNLEVSKKTEIAMELFDNSDYKLRDNEVLLNIGARFNLNKHFTLLVSAGNNFILHNAEENKFIAYLGLQLSI